ncbi:EcoKI restriction-modification system protein HsdS [Ruminococcus bromii]|nr:restriction endonuclease subunit S [Ruminococcus bromii]PKD31105.1 EcoKI restriction-modification system protein HsdS [Ruminococcus bromii]
MVYNESKYNKNWKTMKLSDLGEFARGKSTHRPRNDKNLFEGGGYPLVQTGEIKEANLYITHHTQEYGEFGLQQSKLWDAETLCITIAANIAETALLAYPMCFPDSVVGFKAYKEVSSEKFMYYVFDFIRNSIQNAASGSTQDNINIDYLTSLDFKVPDKIAQDKMVELLSAIDEKILMNSKINDNLEQQAKLLYDYWFTQFDFPDENGKPYRSSGGKMVWNEQLKMEIPFSWICSKMENAIEAVRTGLNPRNNFQLGNGNIQYITVKNLCLNGSLDFSGCDTIDEQARQIVHRRSDIQRDDILFASIAPLGRCYLIQENPTNWDINESVFSIRYNSSVLTAEYLYMNLQSETFVKRATACSTGSIFKGIRINSLMDSEIILPPLSVTKEFSKEIKPLFALQKELDRETHTLIQLRDWLLPMLMNGQATISD